MKSNEVTYSKLLKEVHPDLHPEIKESYKKIEIIKKYKNDIKKLIDLAYSWGLLEDKEVLRYATYPYEPFMLLWTSINNSKYKRFLIVDVEELEEKIKIVLYDYDEYSYKTIEKNNLYDQSRECHVASECLDRKHSETIIYKYLDEKRGA